MSIALRAAGPDDTESIAALHADSWRRTYRGMMPDAFLDGDAVANRRHVWHQRLQAGDPRQFVGVAEDDATIVGFICAFAKEDAKWGSYIDNLHVAHDRHGQGIGRALMQNAAAWLCRVEPESGVYLWVMEANASARRFYDRLGARNAETTIKEDPGGGQAPNCRYTWLSPRLLL